VKVTATVANTTVQNYTTLTVGGQTVSLSLGTGNTITALSSTQYEMPFTVQAVDSAGHGVVGVTVDFSLQATGYFTGSFGDSCSVSATTGAVTCAGPWAPNTLNSAGLATYYVGPCIPTTVKEYNGVINPVTPPTGVTPVETNIPGSVASTDNSTVVTTTGGTAPVNIIYPKDHAYWVQVVLTATATVSGTQSSTSSTFVLPGLASDYDSTTVSPPGQISPYGNVGVCWN
jgi:hypothetical protein